MRQLLALILSISIISILLTFPINVGAQSIDADISIDVVPLNPSPGSSVILSAKSYGGDLNRASITWTYNGVTIAKGVGKTDVSVIAPASGATGVVTITANSTDFNNTSASIILRPASIDVLWEATDAYTPPFYKGKALLAPNGLVRFTAIPFISAPKNLSYDWSRNDSALPDDSGYNKSSVTFNHSEFNKTESVSVTASGGVFTGTGNLSVKPKDPTFVIYNNEEGFINYANGYTNTVPFQQSGIVLHFEPYNFSIPNNSLSDLNFDLKIDDQTVSRNKANEIGLSRPNTAGQSILDLTITPIVYSLQHAEKRLTLLFN